MMMAPAFSMVAMMLISMGPATLSIPPLPEDKTLSGIAPPNSILYMQLYGSANPDPKSTNRVERLMAEPQVQKFIQHIEQQVRAAMSQGINDPNGPQAQAAQHGFLLLKTALTRPASIFITDFAKNAQGGPDITGGLVINVKGQAAQVKRALSFFEMMMSGGGRRPGPGGAGPPQAKDININGVSVRELPQMGRGAPGPIRWGIVNGYAFISIGNGMAEHIVSKVKNPGAAPAWLSNAKSKLMIKRPSMVMHIDLKAALKKLPAIAPNDRELAMVMKVLSAMGLDNVKGIDSVAGLGEDEFVTKSLLSFDGAPKGIFTLFDGAGLKKSALQNIPADSTYGLAFTLDAHKGYSLIKKIISEVDKDVLEEFEEGEKEIRQQLGFDINNDILKHIGSSWTLHNAPSEGGLLFTGLMATVNIKDHAELAASNAKLFELLKKMKTRERRGKRHEIFQETFYRGYSIYYGNMGLAEGVPFAPAWCITDTSLLVALFPQTIKAHIDRIKAGGGKSLATNKQVAALLKDKKPISVAYVDTPELVKMFYPIMHPVAVMMSRELAWEGFNLDISKVPSANVILKNLKPNIAYSIRTKDGFYSESHSSLPVADGGAAALMMFPAFLFSTQAEMRAVPPAQFRGNIKRARPIRKGDAKPLAPRNGKVREAAFNFTPPFHLKKAG